uniref:glucuronosyltransferase n=1 Tax=Phasianus colchicus TaxID=9054 RepID=A0A669QBW8_PHACC
MALVLPSHPQVSVSLLLLLSVLGLAAGGKLLVVPVDGSHWLSMREVLDGLKQKGHEIVVVAPEVSVHIKPTNNFIMKMYPVPFTQEEMDVSFREFSKEAFAEGSFLERLSTIRQRLQRMSAIYLSTCERLLYNKELIRYLEESEFDALFTDPFLPCGQILAEHLSIPSVFLLQQIPCGLDIDATQCPNPPSYVPRIFSGNSDHMNFLQRVKNILFDIPHSLLCHLLFQPYTKLASEFLQRDVTVLDLLRKASIWLVRFDFVFHYPKPLMPNMIIIGGITCTHKKLSQVGDALVSFFTYTKHRAVAIASELPGVFFLCSTPTFQQEWPWYLLLMHKSQCCCSCCCPCSAWLQVGSCWWCSWMGVPGSVCWKC